MAVPPTPWPGSRGSDCSEGHGQGGQESRRGAASPEDVGGLGCGPQWLGLLVMFVRSFLEF